MALGKASSNPLIQGAPSPDINIVGSLFKSYLVSKNL